MKRFATVGAVVIGAWLILAAPALARAAGRAAVSGRRDRPARLRLRRHLLRPTRSPQAEAIIAGIEDRTGAQVAVYTQVKPESDDLDKANADALALMDQWGVGRKGFDDGLVILFDMQANLRHGQVSLYAGSGYPGRVPERRRSPGDLRRRHDAAARRRRPRRGLLVGLNDIDANATPEHAAALEQRPADQRPDGCRRRR